MNQSLFLFISLLFEQILICIEYRQKIKVINFKVTAGICIKKNVLMQFEWYTNKQLEMNDFDMMGFVYRYF